MIHPTRQAAGGLTALMLVAYWTVHRRAGFWITACPDEGWEYGRGEILGRASVVLATRDPGRCSRGIFSKRGLLSRSPLIAEERTVDDARFPALREEYQPTLVTLHSYARAAAAIPRAHGIAHPRWWHTGLHVLPGALRFSPVPLPDGEALEIRLDLVDHCVVLETGRDERRFDMRAGRSGTEMGEALISAAAEFGLSGGYDMARFEDSAARSYDRAAAAAYQAAFGAAAAVFERHRAGRDGRVSPVLVWPHGFDIAFEWYGTRMVEHEGAMVPAQLNLGFYPAGTPYFYSNPWPFDPALTSVPLPHGAVWHTAGWEGTKLDYEAARGAGGAAVVAEYARAVFEVVAPTLTSPL